MAVAGIIAEYNPFHLGHAWQLRELRRRLGADTAVVAVMSGSFVQRGDLAIAGKFARAEMALRGGADLVLELPMPWSAATAERFAQGGAAALAAAGVVTHLVFGSESGDLAPLQAAADCVDSGAYRAALRRHTGGGMTFAAAREAAVRELAGGRAADCLSRPNDTLAVEYLRALNAQKSAIVPVALPRVGAGHDSGDLGDFPSASAIRGLLLAGGNWRDCVPETTAALLDWEMAAGRAPVTLHNCERAVLAKLRAMSEEDFRPYDGGGEGLYHRFYKAVRSGCSLEDILAAAKTKRYPMARLRRMLLHSWLGVPQAAQGETPPYLRVLGATAAGRALLARMRDTASLPVIVRPGHIRAMEGPVQTSFDREARLTDLYTLAYPTLAQAMPEADYTSAPVML